MSKGKGSRAQNEKAKRTVGRRGGRRGKCMTCAPAVSRRGSEESRPTLAFFFCSRNQGEGQSERIEKEKRLEEKSPINCSWAWR